MAINQMADNGLTAKQLEEYNYYVGLRQSLERLENNPDFQKVILEGYFKDKAVNGVSILAAPYIKKNGLRADVMEGLVAISNLQDYFLTIKDMGAEDEEVDELAEDDGLEG